MKYKIMPTTPPAESDPERPLTQSLRSLGETKKALATKLNEDIVSLLQDRNYPVGFDGIKIPTVSDSDFEVKDSWENVVVISERAKKRVLNYIKEILEEKYVQEKIQAKIETLTSQLTGLREELHRIPQQIKDITAFKPFWQKEKNDIIDYETRQNMLPPEITRIRNELSALWIIRPYSPAMISTIIAELRVILSETMRFEEPVKIKELPLAEEQTLEPDAPTLGAIKQARTLGFRMATAVAVITLGSATLGTQWWMNRKVSKKAETEMQAKQEHERQNCLSKNPDVIAWLGFDNCETITTLEIEQTAEKIKLVWKNTLLAKKYAGRKIFWASIYEIAWQVPEDIHMIPYVYEKIISDWQNMCGENAGPIMDLYFSGVSNYQKGIMDLFSRYHPEFKYANRERLYSYYSFNGTNTSKTVVNKEDILYVSLSIRDWVHLFQSPAGIMGEYIDKILKKGILEVQNCIEKGIEWCDIIRDFHEKLPDTEMVRKTIESLLNQKCLVPSGKQISIIRSGLRTDNNHRIVTIELLIQLPGPDGTRIYSLETLAPRW